MIYVVLGIIVFGIMLLVLRKLLGQKRQQTVFQKRLDQIDLNDIRIEHIDLMLDGSEFEMYLYEILLRMGYADAYKTVGSRDFGADVVFTDSTGVRTIIQAKRYSIDSQVGLDAVQEVYTARNYYRAKKTIVISSTTYTESCETLAGVNGVLLLDRTDLIDVISAFRSNDYNGAKRILEREPRVIYEFWNDRNAASEIKKDHRAERMISAKGL